MMMLSRTLAHIAYQFSILILFSLTHVAFLVPCAAPRQHKDQARRHTILQLAHRPRQQHGQPSQRCDVRRTPCLADQRYSLVRNPTLFFFACTPSTSCAYVCSHSASVPTTCVSVRVVMRCSQNIIDDFAELARHSRFNRIQFSVDSFSIRYDYTCNLNWMASGSMIPGRAPCSSDSAVVPNDDAYFISTFGRTAAAA